MIETEKVFDLLPYVVDIYDKLELETFAKTLPKGVSQKEAGTKVVLHVLKHSAKIKEELFEVISILEDVPVEEVKQRGLARSIKTLKALFTEDQEVMTFFKSAMK